MERVEFEQEQILAELKDLEDKGLFSKVGRETEMTWFLIFRLKLQAETHAVMKQRTLFETALIRRTPLKTDFLRYAEYEMNLEALRRKRVARLSTRDIENFWHYKNVSTKPFYRSNRET